MRIPHVIGNWKMNGTLAEASALATAVAAGEGAFAGVSTAVCPPYPHLAAVARALDGSPVALGAQNVCEHEAGAYTGEVAVTMLAELGVRYVILGHSERRALFGDTHARIAAKLDRVLAHGLTPVLCVGETLAEREAGTTEEVIAAQLTDLLARDDLSSVLGKLLIAYEPVWAIGTGRTATPEQAQAVHAYIRTRIARLAPQAAARLPLLYGGSVKAANAAELFAMPDVDGGLIGGAALKADEFIAICAAARGRLG